MIRATKHGLEVLAFRHPSAGNQFVKGTIQQGEQPRDAAKRELLEESGLDCPIEMSFLGALHATCRTGTDTLALLHLGLDRTPRPLETRCRGRWRPHVRILLASNQGAA
ncbi:NUDIX domain-containing protein [Sinorhizobium meliloti]